MRACEASKADAARSREFPGVDSRCKARRSITFLERCTVSSGVDEMQCILFNDCRCQGDWHTFLRKSRCRVGASLRLLLFSAEMQVNQSDFRFAAL